jgi:hypothetical protein
MDRPWLAQTWFAVVGETVAFGPDGTLVVLLP